MRMSPLGRTGMRVSCLGLGTSALAGVFGRGATLDEARAVVLPTLAAGVNYIDTAPWYGQGVAETVLGHVLRDVERGSVYIATKVGRYEPAPLDMFDFTAARVRRSVYESLDRLGLEYLDVVNVHDPEFAPCLSIITRETLPALAQLKAAGVVRHIGVAGYPLPVLERLVRESTTPIDVVQSYCHYVLHNDALLSLVPLLERRGIGLVNAAPMSMGLLTSGPHRAVPAWHPAPADVREACETAAEYAFSHGVSLERLAVHFSTSHPAVPTTLVSTASAGMMAANVAAATTPLTAVEQRVLAHIRDTILKPLGNATWGDAMVRQHWCDVAAAIRQSGQGPGRSGEYATSDAPDDAAVAAAKAWIVDARGYAADCADN